jgi:type VI secretion system protein ImpJ
LTKNKEKQTHLMRINKPPWHEGLVLTQQHFQQQESRNDFSLRQFTHAALTSGRLKLHFSDGTPIDSTLAQDLPPARDLTQKASRRIDKA